MTTEMIAKGGFPNAVLCVNPEKDGTVLITTQEEVSFMTESGDLMKEMNELRKNNPGMSETALEDFFVKRKQELANRNPLIAWYRLDPEKGKIERLPIPPPGGAENRRSGVYDVWRPMPDGSVKMNWREAAMEKNFAADEEAKKAADVGTKTDYVAR